MMRDAVAVYACVGIALAGCGRQPLQEVPPPSTSPITPTTPAAAPVPAPEGWRLTFADEFDAPEGTPPDPARWGYDVGGHGWGNNELQCYTTSTENCFHDGGGHLIIRAIKRPTTDDAGNTREYSSARILTKGKFAQQYGRFEARLKLPRGKGVWPAFWTLGENFATKGWPACGEIDIMEHLGHDPVTYYTTIHGPGYSGQESLGGPTKIAKGPNFQDAFHVFAMEWDAASVRWYLDGTLCHTRSHADLAGKPWVFDAPFFMILNLAVGGHWPGEPDASTLLPQDYVIDYVRAYERAGE
jgi:beta-glucanase (GH16 family)